MRVAALLALAASVLLAAPAQPSRTAGARNLDAARQSALTVEGPVTRLAADGGRVAFAVRHRYGCARVGVWTPPRAVTTLRSAARCVGGDHSPREGTPELALAGGRAAWVQTAGGNNAETQVWTAGLATRVPVQLAYEVAGGNGVGTSAGRVRGDGKLLVFSTSRRCEVRDDAPAIACPPGFETGGIDSETIWRVAPPGRCPDARPQPPRLCTRVRTTAEEQTPLAVDAGRIVARRRSGTIELVDGAGRHLARFRFGQGVARAAALHGNDLVIERAGALDVFDLAAAEKKATWPLPPAATLQDVHGGVAAYLADGRLHLVRLSDGAGVRLARATAAQLEGPGLSYASGRRIVFVPWAELPAPFSPAPRPG